MNLLTHHFLQVMDAAQPEGGGGLLITLLPMILLFGLMYFLMIRPQRKREKEVEEMRSQLQVGDEVISNGGIIGRVVSIQEDTIVVETGTDRSKIRLARWAIQANNTVRDDVPEE